MFCVLIEIFLVVMIVAYSHKADKRGLNINLI